MRKLTLSLLLLAVVAGFVFVTGPAPTAQAQYVITQADRVLAGDTASGGLSADDSDVAIIVKYNGTAASATVEVAANGDITFKDGASGSEAVIDEFECPVSGALGGIIDVSDAACDTLGEVVDTINGNCTGCTAGGWKAVILDGLRTDSSNDTLLTFSATSAQVYDGVNLKWDTDVAFKATYAMTTMRTIQPYIDNRSLDLVENPFAGTRGRLIGAKATSTYASGTSTLEVYSVKVTNGTKGSETATKIWSQTGGATATEKVFDIFQFLGLDSKKGEKLIVRLNNSAAMSSVTLMAAGTQYRYN